MGPATQRSIACRFLSLQRNHSRAGITATHCFAHTAAIFLCCLIGETEHVVGRAYPRRPCILAIDLLSRGKALVRFNILCMSDFIIRTTLIWGYHTLSTLLPGVLGMTRLQPEAIVRAILIAEIWHIEATNVGSPQWFSFGALIEIRLRSLADDIGQRSRTNWSFDDLCKRFATNSWPARPLFLTTPTVIPSPAAFTDDAAISSKPLLTIGR